MKFLLNSLLQPIQVYDSFFFWWLLPRHGQETEHVRIDTFLEVSGRIGLAMPMLLMQFQDPYRRAVTNPELDTVLHSLRRLTERGNYGNLPTQVLEIFLYVASHEGCHKPAMEEDLGMSSASGSRNSDYLCKTARYKRAGLDLITKEDDPDNRRRMILRLTPSGIRLKNDLLKDIYGISPNSQLQETPKDL